MTVVSKQAAKFAYRYHKIGKVFNKVYVPIVTSYVRANYVLAWYDGFSTDDYRHAELEVAATFAVRYNEKLLKQFKRKEKRLSSTTIDKIIKLTKFISMVGADGVLAAKKGVTIKENGLPDFTPYTVRPIGTVFTKLSGVSRGRDETLANNVRRKLSLGIAKRQPDNTTWHHHEVVGVMQLVPTERHLGIDHSGGVLFYEILTNSQYKKVGR